MTLLATSTGQNKISISTGYTYQSLDITNSKQVSQVTNGFRPTHIINTAALTLVDLCEDEVEKCHDVNVKGPAHLLKAAKEHSAHLVQVSTDFVFDGLDGPYVETDETNPLSEYARSKHEAELLLQFSDYKKWSIARTIILYGAGENLSRSNVVLWAREALRNGESMSIVDDQFRSPTLAEDLAEGCWAIAERSAYGVYHLSGPEVMSILEMVQRIARYYNFDEKSINPVKTDSLARPAARPPRTGFIIDKARKDLDYDPRTIEQGLALIDEQAPLAQ